ncbi:hypothetical protein SLS56_006933 [Neofusicoccum ribis]|uniref:MARVEL domain-containing protein n=1 Tax=Neofusicoccum ribis TaxID=45134 RepID=A0ABR3SR03_9PEZI
MSKPSTSNVFYCRFDKANPSTIQASATIITSTYHLVATLGSSRAYNGWAILILDILFLILWLISFSHAASLTSSWASDGAYDAAYSSPYDNCQGIMVPFPVIGAIESVLFLAALTTFSLALHRHRRAGLPLSPNKSMPPPLCTTHPRHPGPANGHGIPLEKPGPPAAPQLDTASPPPQHQPFYHGQSSPAQLQSPIFSPVQPGSAGAPHGNAGVYTPSPITSAQSLVSPIGTVTSGGGGGGAGRGRYYRRPADGAQELQASAAVPKVGELGTWRAA